MSTVSIQLSDLPGGRINIECICKPDIDENNITPCQGVALAVMSFITEQLGTPAKLEQQGPQA